MLIESRQWFQVVWQHCRKLPKHPSFSVFVHASVILVALAVSVNRDHRWILQRQHLGAEAYNVAQALVDGRGFSDPFGEATGPTAWTPPLYPALLAVLIKVFDSRSGVSAAILTLKVMTLIAGAVLIHSLAERFRTRLPPFLAVGFYLLWIIAFHHWYLVLTSDIWLGSLLVGMFLVAMVRTAEGQTPRPWVWGTLCGVCTLHSPTLGFAGLCCLGWLFVTHKPERRRYAVAVAMAVGIGALWVGRNALVFDALVPIKSNLAFEAQQANVFDDDGIYDPETLNQHPFNRARLRFQYARLGEQAFVASAGKRVKDLVARHPEIVMRKVMNRALATTVKLVPAKIHDPPLLIRLQSIIFPLPFVGLLVGLLFSREYRSLFALLAVFYISYLLPYVVVAFYLRYLFPLTFPMMFLAFMGADTIAARLWRARTNQVGDRESSRGWAA